MIGAKLLDHWKRAEGSALGRALFGRALGRAAPYTGSIRPEIVALAPGHARVAMKDRRAVRNHLRSVHAIALVNLGEVTSGLALLTGLPADARGIVKGLSVEYLKKARGRLVAACDCEPPPDSQKRDVTVEATIRDAEGDAVAVVRVDWRVGPVSS
ncbi:MAG: hotdog fold domain-containing protein [Planctomycetota bacterium]